MVDFIYKASHWKNKMVDAITNDEKLTVAGNFAHTAVTYFTLMSSNNNGAAMKKCLKEIDKHARWMVTASDGICDGYRLTSEWMRTILAQITIDGARDSDMCVDECKRMITYLWNGLGWDSNLSINPEYSNINTLYPIRYDTNGEDREFNIVLEPTGEFPAGLVLQSKSGGLWEVVENVGKSILCLGQEVCKNGNYPLMPFSEAILRGWKIV